ncbi:MAG: diacylglycerol kinase family lipid kinase [Acidobacteria bacterium]|nr:diacylglycerol kinase family lipid kinase [Acidobacteriota bacterium]
MRRAVLIYNPVAGRQRAARQLMPLLTALREAGFKAEPTPTAGPGDATRLAAKAAEDGTVEAVFTYGGDGTLREAAVGLLGTEVPLCPLAGGTTNVVVRALGLPLRPLTGARRAGTLVRRRMDVGRCADKPFLMMASSGLDASVLNRQDAELKARYGRASVLVQGVGEWWTYDYAPVVVEADGRTFEASFAALCNLPLYGGTFRLAPSARPDDGRLELVLFHGKTRAATLAFALAVARGSHVRRADVQVVSVEEAVFAGPEGLPIQVDGDPVVATAPVRIDVGPERLWVLAPPDA